RGEGVARVAPPPRAAGGRLGGGACLVGVLMNECSMAPPHEACGGRSRLSDSSKPIFSPPAASEASPPFGAAGGGAVREAETRASASAAAARALATSASRDRASRWRRWRSTVSSRQHARRNQKP